MPSKPKGVRKDESTKVRFECEMANAASGPEGHPARWECGMNIKEREKRTKVRGYECTGSERNPISNIERRTSNFEVPRPDAA